MYSRDLKFRETQREAFCRVCVKKVKRNTEKLIVFYSSANKGGNVFICKSCVEKMNELIKEENEQ